MADAIRGSLASFCQLLCRGCKQRSDSGHYFKIEAFAHVDRDPPVLAMGIAFGAKRLQSKRRSSCTCHFVHMALVPLGPIAIVRKAK